MFFYQKRFWYGEYQDGKLVLWWNRPVDGYPVKHSTSGKPFTELVVNFADAVALRIHLYVEWHGKRFNAALKKEHVTFTTKDRTFATLHSFNADPAYERGINTWSKTVPLEECTAFGAYVEIRQEEFYSQDNANACTQKDIQLSQQEYCDIYQQTNGGVYYRRPTSH